MYDILLKTLLAHVYNYFWWTATLLVLVCKQEIKLPNKSFLRGAIQ